MLPQFSRSDEFSDSSFLELIYLTFGQNFSNTTDARTWLKNNGYYTTYPDVVSDNLMLNLDAQNLDSFRGEPTTNLSYDNGQPNSIYLISQRIWVNSGAWTSNYNETDVLKPNIANFNNQDFRVSSGIVTTAGSIHFGMALTYITTGQTYTLSVYFRQNRAGSSSPYFRTLTENISLGNLSYNGDTSTANWPVNEWIRISATATITYPSENAIFISNYISVVDDKIWYFGHQVEQKDYLTPLVAGTRGLTCSTGGGWCDLSGNDNNATLYSGITHDSDYGGSLIFENNSNFNVPVTATNLPASTNFTLSAWVNSNDISQSQNVISRNSPYFMRIVGSKVRFNVLTSGNSWLFQVGTTLLYSDTWYYLAMTYDGTNFIGYINGIEEFNVLYSGVVTGAAQIYIGYTLAGGEQSGFNGRIATVQIHNKTLTSTEINQIFDSQKERFGVDNDIISDGLMLHLDSSDSYSYPGSGTIWYDLSGNDFHHTIVNSPTHSYSDGFTLDGTQGFTYNDIITTDTNCTVVVFYKTTDIQEVWIRGNSTSYYFSASNNNNYYHNNAGSPTNYVDLTQVINPYASGYKDGEWHMWEAKGVNLSTWTQYNWWLYGGAWNLNGGSNAIIMIYNKVLSEKESLQNFNAHKNRFGL